MFNRPFPSSQCAAATSRKGDTPIRPDHGRATKSVFFTSLTFHTYRGHGSTFMRPLFLRSLTFSKGNPAERVSRIFLGSSSLL